MTLGLGTVLARPPTVGATPSGEERRPWIIGRWAQRLMGMSLLMVGAISVLISTGGGLYWIVGGMVFAIAGAVTNAWVLLVEILR